MKNVYDPKLAVIQFKLISVLNSCYVNFGLIIKLYLNILKLLKCKTINLHAKLLEHWAKEQYWCQMFKMRSTSETFLVYWYVYMDQM